MSEDSGPTSGAPEPAGPAPGAPEPAGPAPGAPEPADRAPAVPELADKAPPLGLDPEPAPPAARPAAGATGASAPVIDPRRYGWMIGAFGLAVVAVISVISFLQHGVVTTGVPPHQRLRYFAAPLAASTLNGDANVAHPTCSQTEHDPRALNVCLLVERGPLVLAFFVPGAGPCTQEVDTMQAVARQFPTVTFAAVAVHAGHAAVARVVRTHGWTIPVAYDADGAVGYQYGVGVCPLVELAYRGGIVQDRLIGEHWAQAAALMQRVRALLAGAPR